MDTYVSLALIIVFLLLCLIGFVYYKESGWKLVKKDDINKESDRESDRERRDRERREYEERERRERWRREHERDRYR